MRGRVGSGRVGTRRKWGPFKTGDLEGEGPTRNWSHRSVGTAVDARWVQGICALLGPLDGGRGRRRRARAGLRAAAWGGKDTWREAVREREGWCRKDPNVWAACLRCVCAARRAGANCKASHHVPAKKQNPLESNLSLIA